MISQDKSTDNTLDQEKNEAVDLDLEGTDSQEPTCSVEVEAPVTPAMSLLTSKPRKKNTGINTSGNLPSGFSIEDDGLCYTKVDKEGNVEKIIIGDALHVIAKASNKTGGNQTRLVKFHEKTRGIDKEIPLSIKELYRDPMEVLADLADEGYVFRLDKRTLLVDYLVRSNTQTILLSAPHTGWLSDSTFALPHKIISTNEKEKFLYTGDVRAEAFGEKGTLESWQDLVATPAYDYPLFMFAIGCAFAAPLLRELNISGGGLHLAGYTGTGKTTGLLVASSVTGIARINGYVMAWTATTNGLEALAEAYNDVLLPLDEIHQADPKAIQQMLYLLANGRGKQRANRQGDQKPTKTWTLLSLSSGEISVKTHCVKAPDGVLNRMIDIEVVEKIPPDFCKKIALAAEDNYGTAMPKYLEYVIKNKHKIRAGWREFQAKSSRKGVAGNSSGNSDRILTRFDLVAYAGKVAYEAGVLPQNPSAVIDKFIKVASAQYLTIDRDAAIVRIVQQYVLENNDKIYVESAEPKYYHEIVGVAIEERVGIGEYVGKEGEEGERWEAVEYILLKDPLEAYLRQYSTSLRETLSALEAKNFLGKGEEGRGKQKRFSHPTLKGRPYGYPVLANILSFK